MTAGELRLLLCGVDEDTEVRMTASERSDILNFSHAIKDMYTVKKHKENEKTVILIPDV
ncbi:MAG: hypothetical protein Q4G33_05905 [bacterium]|nr:hypothetical protein [bacterium]